MSKGKRVPKVVRARIAEVAYSHPDWGAFELVKEVTEHFKGTDLYIPGPDSFRKIAKEARRPGEEDVPWNIGIWPTLVSSEDLPDILAVWRWSKLMMYGFTARQAKWVARLRLVLREKGKDPKDFYRWATMYAAREKTIEVRNPRLPLDTSDLDAMLAFEGDVYWAMVDTGRVERWPYGDEVEAQLQVAQEYFLNSRSPHIAEEVGEDSYLDYLSKWNGLQRSETEKGRDDAGQTIATIWLQRMFKDSGSKHVSTQRRLEVGVEVYRQVVDFLEAKPILGSLDEPHFRPTQELLTEVGYKGEPLLSAEIIKNLTLGGG